MKKLVTLSSTPLAVNCTHWRTLDLAEEPANDSSILGDMLHEKIECALLGKPIPKFLDCKTPGRQEVPKRFWNWHHWATEIGLFSNPKGSEVLVERQVAYSPVTGKARFLPKKEEGKKRDYSLADADEICGTLDYARLVPSTLSHDGMDLVVLDWKSYDWNGKRAWKRTFKHASTDMQARGLAAILASIYKPKSVFAGMVYIPPVDELGNGRPFGDIVQIPLDEIPDILMQLDRCSTIDATPRPGDHCKEHWCSAGPKKQKVCSAWP